MPEIDWPAAPCAICDSAVSDDHAQLMDSERICPSCAARLPCCDRCRGPSRRLAVTIELGRLCPRCAAGWRECARCRYYSPATWPTDAADYVCPQCVDRFYDHCAVCSVYTAESRYVSGGTRVCSRCAPRYSACEHCGTLLPRYTDCDSCDADGRIWNYNYKPDPRFFGTGPVFLGLELEIVVPEHHYQLSAQTVTDHVRELAYLKHDSSIEPLGFELVTHPMDYTFAIEHFPWPVLEQLSALGCYSDHTVGIHVHLSRAGFDSPAHIYRWAKLIYRNESHTVALARRRSPFAQFSATARERVKHTAKDDVRRFGLNRYQAINPHPRASLELRVFAGSLDRQQVQAALAFAAATVEYTRALDSAAVIQRGGWDWHRFTAWVRRRPEYAPLQAELEGIACAC